MRVFSGIQPTGQIHIGNYLAALRQWVKLQHKHECFFCIVDLHSLTVPYDPKELRERVFEKVIAYLASGIDPKKSTIFVQSDVKEHTEFCWLLGTITPLAELLRMTQFKEKAKKHQKNVNAGLLNYPILMAADILLYKTDIVPVGKDQLQHIELTREVVRRFNRRFGKVLKLPRAKIPQVGQKIMSLREPTKKMSKSDPEDSFISLFDPPSKIREKIMSAVTDSEKVIKYHPEKKPGISNLMAIFSGFSGLSFSKIEKVFEKKGYHFFKKELANLLIEKLTPFREAKKLFEKEPKKIREILKNGKKRAQKIAKSTLAQVKEKMGLKY